MANYIKSFNFRNGMQVDNDNFIVNAVGRVGIGTTVPEKLLIPLPAEKMVAWKVSRKVSAPTFDNPDCLKKLDDSVTDEKNPEPPDTQASLFS